MVTSSQSLRSSAVPLNQFRPSQSAELFSTRWVSAEATWRSLVFAALEVPFTSISTSTFSLATCFYLPVSISYFYYLLLPSTLLVRFYLPVKFRCRHPLPALSTSLNRLLDPDAIFSLVQEVEIKQRSGVNILFTNSSCQSWYRSASGESRDRFKPTFFLTEDLVLPYL